MFKMFILILILLFYYYSNNSNKNIDIKHSAHDACQIHPSLSTLQAKIFETEQENQRS
jgi:hypothetical protein